jgi:hypothetical protein
VHVSSALAGRRARWRQAGRPAGSVDGLLFRRLASDRPIGTAMWVMHHQWAPDKSTLCPLFLPTSLEFRCPDFLPGRAAARRPLPDREPNVGLGCPGLFAIVAVARPLCFVCDVRRCWRLLRSRDRSAGAVLLSLGAALVCARLIGGFFVSGPFPPAGGIFETGFYLRDYASSDAVLGQLQWNLASFGTLLILGVVGLLRARRESFFLAILTALTLVIVNLLRYKFSWDIVKFATVGFIALAIGAGVALSDLAGWAHTLGRRLIYGVLIVTLAGQGLLYPFVLLVASYNPDSRLAFSMQMIRPYFSHSYPVNRDDAQAVSFLRSHMGPAEIVYRTEEKSEPYAIWGGVPTQASVYAENGNDDVYGLGPKKLAARRELRSISGDWFDRLLAERVTWVVADADDITITTALECQEGQRRAVLTAQYGKVRVFHIQ